MPKTPFTRRHLIASLIGALIMGAGAAAVSTFAFYDYLFGPGHTDHERGVAWSIVAASTVGAATFVLVIGFVSWVIKLCYRGLTGSPRSP
ncbi:MAG TPA: hypothetical protein VG826_20190 [Pirellulales bacterium]|nr:hypothetical protein [Pirellulales bacterium]